MTTIHLAAGSVNQTPLDWNGNTERILATISQAKNYGVQVLCLPELAITGYGCEDVFFSKSCINYSLVVLEQIKAATDGIAVLVGLPVIVNEKRYNAAAFLFDGELQGIVGKRILCNDGVHYEGRWFSAWPTLERTTIEVGGQQVPFGDIAFDLDGFRIGVEICEDAWVPTRPAWDLAKRDVDVILNPSASHFAFRKYEARKQLMLEAAQDSSFAYVYANLLGCEAGRIMYDGDCIISAGNDVVAEGTRFSFADTQLASACIDLEKLREQRTADRKEDSHFVKVKTKPGFSLDSLQCVPVAGRADWESFTGEDLKCEEFLRAVSLGLFDYLRKTKSGGFVVSLSGGSDSSSVVVLVYAMVKLGIASIGFDAFIKKLGYSKQLKSMTTDRELLHALLTCVYQKTKNNSEVTEHAARELSSQVGAEFFFFELDEIVSQYVAMVEKALGEELSWETDDIALQNIQARTRVPGLWLLANKKNKLLLTTSNRSEAAVGYTTMDGDTAGGFNPIGGIDKNFLLSWLSWMETKGAEEIGPLPVISLITQQQPTAELRPLDRVQTDEKDLMPYSILHEIESYAVGQKLAPTRVYKNLREVHPDQDRAMLLKWTKRFFHLWATNQWKRERYAPSLHVDDKNLDPKTWCRFPILSAGFERELEFLDQYAAKEKV